MSDEWRKVDEALNDLGRALWRSIERPLVWLLDGITAGLWGLAAGIDWGSSRAAMFRAGWRYDRKRRVWKKTFSGQWPNLKHAMKVTYTVNSAQWHGNAPRSMQVVGFEGHIPDGQTEWKITASVAPSRELIPGTYPGSDFAEELP